MFHLYVNCNLDKKMMKKKIGKKIKEMFNCANLNRCVELPQRDM